MTLNEVISLMPRVCPSRTSITISNHIQLYDVGYIYSVLNNTKADVSRVGGAGRVHPGHQGDIIYNDRTQIDQNVENKGIRQVRI
jgi:hypothetical protein